MNLPRQPTHKGFKPRTKGLARTQLRSRSELPRTGRIKPRKTRHRDTPASLKVRADYKDRYQRCEATRLARRLGLPIVLDDRTERHHIIGGSAGRIDIVSNLIVVSPPMHRWLEANPRDGKILCLIVKSRKTPCEVNADDFKMCSGQNLIGWLENNPPNDKRIERHYRELLESLQD